MHLSKFNYTHLDKNIPFAHILEILPDHCPVLFFKDWDHPSSNFNHAGLVLAWVLSEGCAETMLARSLVQFKENVV